MEAPKDKPQALLAHLWSHWNSAAIGDKTVVHPMLEPKTARLGRTGEISALFRAYWQAHMELLGPRPLLRLDDSRWPMGRGAPAPQMLSPSTATADGGTIEDSLISARCINPPVVGDATFFALTH